MPREGMRMAAALLTCLASGCIFAQVDRLQGEVQQLRERVDDLKRTTDGSGERIAAIEQSVHMLACGPELRSLFDNIKRACSAGVGDNCSKNQLMTPLAAFRADVSESVGPTLMTTMRHEVIYPTPKSGISVTRQDRLDAFARDASRSQLEGTRYLLVTAPVPNDAEATRRAQLVRDELVKLGLSEPRFTSPWIYRLFDQDAHWRKFAPVDQPLSTEVKDLGRAVFVFRVSCFGADR